MNKDRDKYESLIRNSILFSLDKEKQAVAYKREALKLVEYLYLYLMAINSSKYGEYGLEITQTAHRCINSYSPENGEFLNYFNSAMSKEYKKAYVLKNQSEQHAGVHIPEREQRLIHKFIKLTESRGIYEYTDEIVKNISDATGISEERVKECIVAYQNSFGISDVYVNSDNEEASLFDLIAYDRQTDKEVEEKENAETLLQHIDEVFSKRQERQKTLLSKLLTAKIAQSIIDTPEMFGNLKKCSFYDQEVFYNIAGGIKLTAKDIGTMVGMSEQSVSRAYKNFIVLL